MWLFQGGRGGKKESLRATGIFMSVSVSSQRQFQVTEGPNYAGTMAAGDQDLSRAHLSPSLG